MKILQVFKLYSPDRGGIVSVMEAIVTGLGNSVEQIILVSRHQGWGSRELRNGTTVLRSFSLGTLFALPLAPLLPLWFWWYARKVAVVDYHFPFPLVDLAVALWFPKRTALVIHWHSEIVQQRRLAQLIGPLIKRCLARADRIIVATPQHISQSSYLMQHAQKCVVVPFGLRQEDWLLSDPTEITKFNALREQRPRLILAVGRLVPYKGFTVLLDAMKSIEATLLIVGSGPLETNLKERAANNNVTARVQFLGDVPQSELRILMHMARMLVMPSIGNNETFGLVQLEAMACGKPIVNTALPTGVPWVARHEQEALTVPPGNVAALAQAIQFFLDNPEQAIAYGERGRQRLQQTFDDKLFCEQTLAVYDQARCLRNT